MNVTPPLLVFLAAAAVSLGTSWLFVTRLERIGERFGMTDGMLGLVAALGANTPEITASVTALIRGQRDVGAGVIVGSNVFNLAALLGLSAIVAGAISLHRSVVVFSGSVAVWIAIGCTAAIAGVIPPIVALLLCLLSFVPYAFVLARSRMILNWTALPSSIRAWLAGAVHDEEEELEGYVSAPVARTADIVLASLALVVVVGASVVMEQAASAVGTRTGMQSIVLGAVVLAAVTSLPNAVTAVFLARRGRGAAVLSTALNSNSLNVLAGLLVPALALGLARGHGALTVSWWYLGMTVGCLAIAYACRGLRRTHGWCIVGAYAVFVVVLIRTT